MVLVPGNNPMDVDTRARERVSEHERHVASGAAEREHAAERDDAERDDAERDDAADAPPARDRVSIVDRVRRRLGRR